MISKIRINNFRNFKDKVFAFSPKTTILVGPNGVGKTNVLEALFLLSTGKSFRARVEEEMIAYESDLARIKGLAGGTKLEIVLTRGQIDIGAERPERVPRKKLLVNGVSRRLIDFAGNFKVTLFGPWNLDLVTESPSLRRDFLDTAISQVDREYRRASLSYERGLRQRNKLLWQMREFPSTPGSASLTTRSGHSPLLFWDQLLIKNGDYLSRKREEFINFVNQTESVNKQRFELTYDKSAISEGRLLQYANEEVAAATTLVGPHRDDFTFNMADRDLARFGSRGEQRMAVLWLKLAELAYVEEQTGERPTLLLDDIFSELDHAHRDVVIKIADKQQTIITTADPHFVETFLGVEKIELAG